MGCLIQPEGLFDGLSGVSMLLITPVDSKHKKAAFIDNKNNTINGYPKVMGY